MIAWHKSTYSQAADCVEFADLGDGTIGMRQSKDPDGPMLTLTKPQFAALLNGAKAGEFDDLT